MLRIIAEIQMLPAIMVRHLRHKIFLSFISTTLVYLCSFGQTDSHKINFIRTYIKQVDSLIDNPNKPYFIDNFLEEGKISKEIVTTKVVGHKNKIDTLRKKIWGGWSKSNYQNHKADTLFKIEYHDNLQKNFYLTFYYKDNKLIYGKVEYQEDGIGSTFYQREEFFEDNTILLVNETGRTLEDDYKRRVEYSLYKRGQEYFEEFRKQK